MLKKIFSLLLCCFIILGVTGCGTNETKTESKTSSEESTTSNNEVEEGEDTTTESTVSYDVTNVYAASTDYAVVRANETTYIIDQNGKAYGTLNISYDSTSDVLQINNNGYVYFYDKSEKNHVIYERNGNVAFIDSNDVTYEYISDSNYTIRKTKSSSYESGSSYTYELVDLNGNVVLDDAKNLSDFIAGNIWLVYNDYLDYSLYNEKTGKISEKLENNDHIIEYTGIIYQFNKDLGAITLDNGGIFYSGWVITSDLVQSLYTKKESETVYVNGKYFYNNEDYGIYDYNGNLVKDFSTGKGISKIYSTGDRYYIESGTYYYYITDKDFNQLVEPYQLDVLDDYRVRALGNNIIVVSKYGSDNNAYNYYIYDFEGNLLEDLGDKLLSTDIMNPFILEISADSDYKQATNKYVNLYTGKSLQVFV